MQRARTFFRDTDNSYLILGLVVMLVVFSFGVPIAAPETELGAICTNLPNPRGGNRQSLLALQGGQEIGLQINVLDAVKEGDEVFLTAGEPITFRLRFTNNDIGPVNIFYTEDSVTVGDPDGNILTNAYGVIFEFVSEANNIALTDSTERLPLILPVDSAPDSPTLVYDLEDLYILRAGGSCFVDIRFSPERLADMGFTVGEYRLRVYYRNRDRGEYIPATPNGTAPTATPMFEHLNVWIGSSQSNRLILTVEP